MIKVKWQIFPRCDEEVMDMKKLLSSVRDQFKDKVFALLFSIFSLLNILALTVEIRKQRYAFLNGLNEFSGEISEANRNFLFKCISVRNKLIVAITIVTILMVLNFLVKNGDSYNPKRSNMQIYILFATILAFGIFSQLLVLAFGFPIVNLIEQLFFTFEILVLTGLYMVGKSIVAKLRQIITKN